MAAIASFSFARENGNANRLADPENLYKPGFKSIIKKKKISQKKKFSCQVAAIVIISGKLKI